MKYEALFMKYQAVFFDFDYTLGDATESIWEGFTYAFGKMGLPLPQREAVRRTVGLLLEDAYTVLTGDDREEKREEFRRWFHEVVIHTQAEKTVLFPGAAELLRALHREGVKVGIVTSKKYETLHNILTRHGLTGYLSYAVGGDQVAAPKPDPEGLLGGMAATGVTPAAVLYCGDTIIDAETARRAGVDFAAVLNGTTTAAEFQPYPSVRVCPDLAGLQAWLGL